MSARHIHKHSIESEFELYDMIVAILITIKSGDWSFYKEIDMWLYYIDWMIDCLNIVKSCCLVAPQRIFGQCLLCIKIFNVMIINEKTSCINVTNGKTYTLTSIVFVCNGVSASCSRCDVIHAVFGSHVVLQEHVAMPLT